MEHLGTTSIESVVERANACNDRIVAHIPTPYGGELRIVIAPARCDHGRSAVIVMLDMALHLAYWSDDARTADDAGRWVRAVLRDLADYGPCGSVEVYDADGIVAKYHEAVA